MILKPCPFCGSMDSQVVKTQRDNIYCVQCNNCGCQGPQFTDTKKMAENTWNKRVGDVK